MSDKLMYILNDNTQNYPFCRLQLVDTQPNEATNENSITVPKVFKPTNKKHYKTLGSSVPT